STPRTTYRLVSLRSWWCQPLTAPGWVVTRPDQRIGSSKARSRNMPGVGSASSSSSKRRTRIGTASLMPPDCHRSIDTVEQLQWCELEVLGPRRAGPVVVAVLADEQALREGVVEVAVVGVDAIGLVAVVGADPVGDPEASEEGPGGGVESAHPVGTG